MIHDDTILRISERQTGDHWLTTWFAFRRDNPLTDLGWVRETIARDGSARIGGGAQPEFRVEEYG